MYWLIKYKLLLIVLLLITFVAYGQTLLMYFLIDDNALIYKLQHPEVIGLWGKGLVGVGAYRYRALQFAPFYPVFGVNPVPYFVVGYLLYYFTSVILFFFTLVVSKSKQIAFAAAAIFSAGYVGSETMFGISNSWETNRGIITALVTFLVYYHFLKTKKIAFYLLSVILFFVSLDTLYVRAHGLIFALTAFDVFVGWKDFYLKRKLSIFKEIVKSFVRLMPFIFIYYQIYLANMGSEARKFNLGNILKMAFVDGKLTLLTIPFQDVGNLFIPDVISIKVDKILSSFITIPAGLYIGSFFSGLLFLALFLFIVIKFINKSYLARVSVFSFLFAIANFMLFYIREPASGLWTTHRYFSYSFVGLSIFFGTVFYLFAKHLNRPAVFKLLTILVIVVYLYLGVTYQKDFNERRSFPAKQFFASFTSAVPNIPKGAVTYFDLINDNQIRGQFGSFFGGMFSEASNLAVYNPNVDYMNDFIFTYKFQDIETLLKEKSTSIDKVFTFYYGEKGLINTTSQTRQLLTEGRDVQITAGHFFSNIPAEVTENTFRTKTFISYSKEGTTGQNPIITIVPPEDTPSLAPSVFSFSLAVRPIEPAFPYKSGGQSHAVNTVDKNMVFSYLLSEINYRKKATAEAASFWKDQKPELVLDNRMETSWRGHRGFWDDIDRGNTQNTEYLSVDLNKILMVSQVRWVSAQKPLVPTHYRIYSSIDGDEWNLLKEIIGKKTIPEGTLVVDSFSPVRARFVKMEMLKTYGNDGPEIKELEVVESQYVDLDRKMIEYVKKEPFGYIENGSQYANAMSFVKLNSVLRFYFMSNADSKQDPAKYVDTPLVVDGREHQYNISLPATGTAWVNFTLEGFNFPMEILIKAPKLTYKRMVK